ncbi:GNAT family N-acetyltransferase [Fontibacillus sp. BL9]|uniref:GNAT family N-acetyltransferase n=1 Tax=Fontibacillus sp. BL9 TaxID=3389971 RepID=UPI00397A9E5D
MGKEHTVELVHFSEERHSSALDGFELPEDQIRFTALPKEIQSVTEGQYRIVIASDGVPVGFFMLHATERVKAYSDNPNAMLLTALSIDHKQQRQGYAKKAMIALKAFVMNEFAACDEVVLVVNCKNTPARQLYSASGFTDTGGRRMGPIGEQYVMKLFLK